MFQTHCLYDSSDTGQLHGGVITNHTALCKFNRGFFSAGGSENCSRYYQRYRNLLLSINTAWVPQVGLVMQSTSRCPIRFVQFCATNEASTRHTSLSEIYIALKIKKTARLLSSMTSTLKSLSNLISGAVDDIEHICTVRSFEFPSLDEPFTLESERARFDPDILTSVSIIVAAASQLIACVREPSVTLINTACGVIFLHL